MTDCLFCKIVRGEIPAKLVAENALCVAFNDIAPQAPVHVLVIPRAHFASLNAVSDAATVSAMAALAVDVAKSTGIAERGYRTVMNTGDDGGQTVHHLHMHVLGGRQMKWPPG
jgi:histidine triad (HIT) family protein